jgi:hypothetical protein
LLCVSRASELLLRACYSHATTLFVASCLVALFRSSLVRASKRPNGTPQRARRGHFRKQLYLHSKDM